MNCRLFSDFNCPFCYAMHERLHGLGLLAQVSWHGVQHARHLSLPVRAWSGHLAMDLTREVEMVRRLALSCPLRRRRGSPTAGPPSPRQPARSALGGLLTQEFIRSLYQLLWVDGEDISDQELPQHTAERHGFPPSQVCGKTALPIDHPLRTWEARWNETEHSGVPLLQRADGALLAGLVPAVSIRRFLAEGARL